jgi:hypothetical protein
MPPQRFASAIQNPDGGTGVLNHDQARAVCPIERVDCADPLCSLRTPARPYRQRRNDLQVAVTQGKRQAIVVLLRHQPNGVGLGSLRGVVQEQMLLLDFVAQHARQIRSGGGCGDDVRSRGHCSQDGSASLPRSDAPAALDAHQSIEK